MSNEDAGIALVRRIFHEGTSAPNPPEVVREIFAEDFVCHGPPGVNHSHDGWSAGPETCMLQNAFRDVLFKVDDVAVDGSKITCRFVAQGTQVADFQGVRPTGRSSTVRGTTTFRIEDHKVKEGWGVLFWD